MSYHKTKFNYPEKIIKYSFFAWLILPLVLIWLTINYIIGAFKDRPGWLIASDHQQNEVEVQAYSRDFPKIEKSQTGYVTLWFDDAWLSQYQVAAPMLKLFGYTATIAVTTQMIEQKNYVNWAQLRRLQSDGWEITNHSQLHDCSMHNWPADKIVKELKESTLVLWQNKLKSEIFVSPCGVNSQILEEQVKKQFIAYRKVDPGINDLNKLDFYNLKVKNIDAKTQIGEIKEWLNTASIQNLWLILVLHKVGETESSEKERFNIKKEDFQTILEYIKNKNLAVVVPSQIFSLL